MGRNAVGDWQSRGYLQDLADHVHLGKVREEHGGCMVEHGFCISEIALIQSQVIEENETMKCKVSTTFVSSLK